MTQPNPAQQTTEPGQPAPGTGTPPQQPAGQTDGQQQDQPLGPAGERALEAMKAELAAAKAQVRDLTPLAEQARQAAEAQKTAEQRLTEQLEAARREAADTRTALLRVQVGTAKGLPPALAERLQGKDEAEMAADADRLLASLPAGAGAPSGPPGAGDAGRGGAPAPLDMNALLRAAAGR